MKKVITAIFLLTAAVTVNAQISLMPKAGLSLSTVDYKSNIGKEKSTTGFTGGLAAEFPVSKGGFSLATELLYVAKGGKLENAGSKTTRTLSYLEIPVLARFTFADIVYVNAGPTFGIVVDGKDKGNNLEQKIKFGSTKNSNQLRYEDIALTIGAGVKIPAGNGKFLFDLRYNHGLADIDNLSNQETRNRAAFFTVGYAFNLSSSVIIKK